MTTISALSEINYLPLFVAVVHRHNIIFITITTSESTSCSTERALTMPKFTWKTVKINILREYYLLIELYPAHIIMESILKILLHENFEHEVFVLSFEGLYHTH